MLREEKGVWNQVYRLLLQFREEAISRVFRLLRSRGAAFMPIIKSVVSLLDDKRGEIQKSIESQLRLVAEKEASFMGNTIDARTKNHPRKIL